MDWRINMNPDDLIFLVFNGKSQQLLDEISLRIVSYDYIYVAFLLFADDVVLFTQTVTSDVPLC